jgi:hypothetical protein
MVSTINDDPFSLEAMYQPYDFFARLRDWEPVHYNEQYEVWMVTRTLETLPVNLS